MRLRDFVFGALLAAPVVAAMFAATYAFALLVDLLRSAGVI